MEYKICFKCKKEQPIDCFYKHPGMADGHVNKCKECNKKDVRENYANKREYYAEYERNRWKDNVERRKKSVKYQRLRRLRNPEKYHANVLTNNAIRDKRLTKKPCEVCGEPKTEAHHEDYYKPLDVIWLCRKHHLEKHGKIPF